MTKKSQKLLVSIAALSASLLAVSGCASTSTDTGANSGSTDTGSADPISITVGTTDKVTTIDPAGSYDNGSFMVMNQVYPFLLNSTPGNADMVPDIAESAEFTSATQYTVKLKSGLKFANGHDLTSSDVKFSFDRQVTIADEAGPSWLLYNLESVDTPDDTTVVFNLLSENDQVFPAILSSPVAPIVDEEVFSATELTSDDDIVAGMAFAGQYVISAYKFNELVQFTKYDGYQGVLGAAQNDTVNLKFYADSSNMKLDIQEGNLDLASRSLSATDIEDLSSNQNVKVITGPGGEIRYIVFNFDIQPYGAKTAEADAAKAKAVRQAAAYLVDREALSTQVYKGTYLPLWSYVPPGLPGANEAVKDRYGAAPDAAAAAKVLADAGVSTPVTLNLQWNPDHYGPSSGDEYALIKSQLESSGLFTVNLQSTEWVTYAQERKEDVYPAHQLGWFPDYSDSENYLNPFFLEGGFLMNHYNNEEVNQLLRDQIVTLDKAERVAKIEEIQNLVAEDLSTLPLLFGAQVAVAGADVDGVTLDASFKLRFGTVTK
jgi:peptide/nickel transport system substrate-binding protein